ncbi:copper resistance protein NlpE N-terminal domain-containing protein [Cyclobacterium sp.]|uniref:copper resistance protein NlpE N-terminal domain-containing protein n=1 Tax=Cyclobacterium sp. TaxID=1966343 RepID=UPI0019B98F7C|nr:copper resistance protein NlpE N-terminal domain-containing protein [Cyclobacterium sp.]MBD3630045.1 copper resistance protein NlpE N-terminal domain-containing protein [Cyclobacterium sp.]
MKYGIPIILVLLVFSCDAPTEESRYSEEDMEEADSREEIVLESSASTWMYYEGLLPCADCEGIRTQLKLENSPEKRERSYELTETYLGTEEGDREFVSSGLYEVVYGLEGEPGAMAIRLLDDSSNAIKSFRQDKEGKLHLLDREEKAIASELNYTLEVVEPKE